MTADLVETISVAAAQSDRWMFVALLTIGVLFSTYLFRHFAKETAAIRAEFREMNEDFITHLKQANREMSELVKSSHETIARNSIIMERVERKLERE